MCNRCGTGSIAWCTDPDRHGDLVPSTTRYPSQIPMPFTSPADLARMLPGMPVGHAEALLDLAGAELPTEFARDTRGADGALAFREHYQIIANPDTGPLWLLEHVRQEQFDRAVCRRCGTERDRRDLMTGWRRPGAQHPAEVCRDMETCDRSSPATRPMTVVILDAHGRELYRQTVESYSPAGAMTQLSQAPARA